MESNMAECPNCKKLFQKKRYNHTYCCKQCKYDYNFSSTAVHEERKCLKCGKLFVSTNDRMHFCSHQCEKVFREQKKGYRRPDLLRRGNTQATEEAYINRISSRYSQFEYAGGWENDYALFLCDDCGTFFRHSTKFTRPSDNKHLRCPSCSKVLSGIKRREKKQAEAQRREELKRKAEMEIQTVGEQISFSFCPVCCSAFVTTKKNKKYCSDRCAKTMIWSGKEIYRNLIPLDVLYERDNGKCYICGGQCDYNDKTEKNGHIIYGNLYPSRDHIIPKSKGGKHTWENMKLAHRICNSLKGAQIRTS